MSESEIRVFLMMRCFITPKEIEEMVKESVEKSYGEIQMKEMAIKIIQKKFK